jgi:hypothetical protein
LDIRGRRIQRIRLERVACPRHSRLTFGCSYDARLRVLGLGAKGRMAFEYEYGTRDCGTGWRAQPVAFEVTSAD